MRLPAWLLNAYRRQRDRRIMHPAERDPIRRYHRRYRLHDCAAALVNELVSPFLAPAMCGTITAPRRILLANFGHLGDVVMSTAAIGIVRRAFPSACLGFLLNGISRVVLENHPHVHRLHVLNHWRLERTGEPLRVRIRRYIRAAARMAEELRHERYDVAVDLRAWWPNAAYVLYRAGIPVRIGYPCLGLQSLLTHPRPFVYRRAHESRIQTDLLRALPIPAELAEGDPPFDMPPPSEQGREEVRRLLNVAGLGSIRYRVIHPGASTPVRDWPVEKWHELVGQQLADGCTLVFTGSGSRDRTMIETIIAGRPRCMNACGRLSWAGLVEVVRAAELVFSVETVTGHVAAAVGTPCVAIYGGMSDPLQWAPRSGPTSVCSVHSLACAPCFHYVGCTQRPCLSQLGADAAYAAGRDLLRGAGEPAAPGVWLRVERGS